MFLWVSLALANPPAPALAKAAVMEPVIALKFAWPDGLSCAVETTTTSTGLGQDGPVTARREFVVRAEGERLRLAHGEGAVVAGGVSASTARRPDVLLSLDGHLRRVDGITQTPAGLALQDRIAAEWERTIGMWSGLFVSETVSGSAVAEGPAAMFPEGASAQWFYRFHVVDRVACAGEAGEPRCLKLAYEANPWGNGMRALLDTGGRAPLGAPEGAAMAWSEMLLGLSGELVIETTTLLPQSRVEETRLHARGAWEGGGGVLDVVTRSEERWSCARRPPPPGPPPLPPAAPAVPLPVVR